MGFSFINYLVCIEILFISQFSLFKNMTQDIGIDELQKLIIKNASEFGYMGTTLSQQSMKLIELEEKIDLLQKMIEEKNDEIKNFEKTLEKIDLLQKMIEEKNDEIKNFEKTLEKIHNSKTWKVLKKLDKFR